MLGTAKNILNLSNHWVQITTRLFSRTENQTTRRNQQTHGLATITQILKGSVFVKRVIDWDFCMGNQLSQMEWSAASWMVTEVCVAMVNVISSWRACTCSVWMSQMPCEQDTEHFSVGIWKLSVQSNLSV